MKPHFFLKIALPLFVLTACQYHKFKIKGSLDRAPLKEVYLDSVSDYQPVNVDSAAVSKDGNFVFEREVPATAFYIVRTKNFQAGVIGNNGSTVLIDADLGDTSGDYTLYGSEDNKKLAALQQLMGEEQRRFENLFKRKMKTASTHSDTAQIMKEATQIASFYEKKVKEFLRINVNSYAAFFAPVYLSIENNYPLFQKIADHAGVKFKGNPTADSMVKLVKESKVAAVGEPAPEITLPGPDGKYKSLSALRGKYVLIDFWASWCGPCREESPLNVSLYQRFKNKGLEIFGVSLDENKQDWINAIVSDHLDWTQVSELKRWNSSVVNQYHFNGIPHNVLIDKQGLVIANNLHGPELEDFLNHLFKN